MVKGSGGGGRSGRSGGDGGSASPPSPGSLADLGVSFSQVHTIEYYANGQPYNKQKAVILETSKGKFMPIDAYGDTGNYVYMARKHPGSTYPTSREFDTYKQAVKQVFAPQKKVKILAEKKSAF